MDIYLLAGQSNAAGTSKIDYSLPKEDRDRKTYRNVLVYYQRRSTDGVYSRDFRFANLKEGHGSNNDAIGPELGMAEVLSEQYRTTDRIAVILKTAAGGTSIVNQLPKKDGIDISNEEYFLERGSWLPTALDPEPDGDYFRPTGFLMREMYTNMSNCVSELISMGCKAENVSFKALCWMQGEDDRRDSHYDVYAEYFALMAEEFRDQATKVSGKDCSEMPIIIGEISETFSSAKEADIAQNRRFIEVQRSIPSLVPATYVIPTAGFVLNEMQGGESVAVGSDRYHWSYRDMLEIGRMFGEEAYKRAK